MPNPADARPHRQLVSLAEAARFLTISPRTLRALIDRGEIPVVRVTPRRVAVQPEDLDRFVAARRE